jgi:hypothetical protein
MYQYHPWIRRCHKIPSSTTTGIRLPRPPSSDPKSLDSGQTRTPRRWFSTSKAIQLLTSRWSVFGGSRNNVRSVQSLAKRTYLSRQSPIRSPQLSQCVYSHCHCQWDDECTGYASSSDDCIVDFIGMFDWDGESSWDTIANCV